MSEYEATIGLEVHTRLKTRSKMFCDSKNDPDETRPNVNICPVCMGHPGTLPTINKEAVKMVLMVGKAAGGELADYTEFDRKNYFYPDIPKGYQISQYKYPLVVGGEIAGVKLTRIHLEEDTAKSFHKGDHSLIDFNRSGAPLMELVTEPVMKSGRQVADFAKEFQLLLRYLEVADADMEKGEMRVEANISLREIAEGSGIDAELCEKLGKKVEIKNLNSFRALERAINFEIKRQSEILEKGEKVVQETRGWDEGKQETFPQRQKEEAQDYRYFPEPDLPKILVSEVKEFADIVLPELPWERRERMLSLGIKAEDAEMYVENKTLGDFFENVVSALGADGKKAIQLASNYISSDLSGLMSSSGKAEIVISPDNFAKLIKMAEEGAISSRGAKDILAEMFEKGEEPEKIAGEKGLLQQSDESALVGIAEKVIAENANVAEDYRKGKESALQFLVGQGMKESKGSANPSTLAKLLKEKLR